jgi:hypothetical protein
MQYVAVTPQGLQWIAGTAFLLLGLLHFIERDHTPVDRSYYMGGIHLGYRTRVCLAIFEMAMGATLLFA